MPALGLVVIGEEAHLVALVADLNATRLVTSSRHVSAPRPPGERIDIERTSLRFRHTDGDDVLGSGKRGCSIVAAATSQQSRFIASSYLTLRPHGRIRGQCLMP